jgi:hypothetical protein
MVVIVARGRIRRNWPRAEHARRSGMHDAPCDARNPNRSRHVDRSKENVPRGDHVPCGLNDASSAEMNQKSVPGTDSAPQRGHGAHGKGVQGRPITVNRKPTNRF